MLPIKPAPQRQLIKIDDLPRRHPANYLETYANNVGTSSNFYDVRFIFGQITANPKDEMHIEDRVGVTMSWEHARQFRDLLNRLLEAYEKENGEVRTRVAEEEPKE